MAITKTWKWAGVIFIAAVLIGSVAAYRVWNKPARDVKEEVGIGVTAQGIFDAYTNDEKKADSLYLNKAIEVSGQISEVSKTMDGKMVISLQTSDPFGGVRCTMIDSAAVKIADSVKIKGECTGFNSDVILIKCYLIK